MGGVEEQQLPSDLGRASRKGAAAAIAAHVAVQKGTPLKQALSDALSASEAKLGGQERRFVAFASRELSRHQRWLDAQARQRGRRRGLVEDEAIARYALWRVLKTGATPDRAMVEVKLPGPVRPRSIKDAEVLAVLQAQPDLHPEAKSSDTLERVAAEHSFPRWLAEALAVSVPEGEVDALFRALNREPELILRARPGRRGAVIGELLASGLAAEELPAPDAILVQSHAVFDAPAMKRGDLQVQDLGSQLIVEHCGPLEGMSVADVCAGAGGKTLALADRAARVFAGDTSTRRLDEARRRARAMGLKNVSFSVPCKCEQADVVLVDAPCSGTGSIAREPDLKWRLTAKRVGELHRTQLQILEDVATRARAATRLVYATCSLLAEENDQVVAEFARAHPEWTPDGEPLRVWPHRSRGGGFFAARLRRAR